MLYLEVYNKNIGLGISIIIISLYIIFILFIAMTMSTRLQAQHLYTQALDYCAKLDNLDDSLLTEKVLFYRKALNLLSRANKLNPRNSRYPFEYAQLMTRIFRDNNSNQISRLIEIPGISDRGDLYGSALTKYAEAINLEPSLAVYHLKLGWVYELMNHEEKAENEFAKAIQLDPTNLKNRIYLAGYLLSKGRELEAFYHACWVKIISKGFSLGEYESAAQVFTESFRKRTYNKINFKENSFLLNLAKEDLPIKIDYPLSLRMEVIAKELPFEAYVYLDYLKGQERSPFILTLEQKNEVTCIFQASDLFNLAKDYARQKKWDSSSGIYLSGVGLTPEGAGIIQRIELIFNY